MMVPETASIPGDLKRAHLEPIRPGLYSQLMYPRRKDRRDQPGAPRDDSLLRTAFVRRLCVRLSSSSSGGNYIDVPSELPWQMMPDIASVRNGDTSLGFLVISAFRTSGHGLGSSVTKVCTLPPGTIPVCPWCGYTVSDDACHALTACQDPDSIDIRHREIGKLRVLMQYRCPSWCDKISAAAPGAEQAALIMCAACLGGVNATLRATIRGTVTDILCQLRKHHPTYKQFFRNTPLQALNYYTQ